MILAVSTFKYLHRYPKTRNSDNFSPLSNACLSIDIYQYLVIALFKSLFIIYQVCVFHNLSQWCFIMLWQFKNHCSFSMKTTSMTMTKTSKKAAAQRLSFAKCLSKKDSNPLHSLFCFLLHHFNSLFSNVLLRSNVCSKAMEVLFWRANGPYPRKEDGRAREESL